MLPSNDKKHGRRFLATIENHTNQTLIMQVA